MSEISNIHDYGLRVKATKKSGREGFLIAFGVPSTGTHYWWNLGGWGNTRSAVEKSVDGGKQTLVENGTTIETGRTYDLRIQGRAARSRCTSTGARGAPSPTTRPPNPSARW